MLFSYCFFFLFFMCVFFFFLMIRRPPRSTLDRSSAASDVYKRQLKEASKKGSPVILEPIVSVEVVTPEEYMGDVMGDLSSRRGRIEGMNNRGDAQVIKAMVPLAEMFGYSTTLRSATQGRAIYAMTCLLYTSPSPRDRTRSRMPSSA